jgi:hypothetical protein
MLARLKTLVLGALALGLAQLAAASDTPHWVHYRLLDGSAVLPKRVVVLPVSVKVFEMTAGGVEEEVPEWTREASRNVLKALSARLPKAEGGGLQEVALPRLARRPGGDVDERGAVPAGGADRPEHAVRTRCAALTSASARPGADPAEDSADAALMVAGRDYASTAGRKPRQCWARSVRQHPVGRRRTRRVVHVGLVDLRSGTCCG